MKTLKILGLFALVIMSFSSCDLIHFGAPPPETVDYNLRLSFQDASGNDLVKGIGLDVWMDSILNFEEQAQAGIVLEDSLYTLDIIVSEPCKNWDNKIYNAPGCDAIRPVLVMFRYNNNYCYLGNYFSVPVNDCPEEKILNYQLKCPYVFGDEAVHEFVTYWDIPKAKSSTNSHYAKCNRVEFDGNEITPQYFMDIYKNGNYLAIIKLNH